MIIGKTIVVPVGKDDQMVQYLDVKKFRRPFYLFGQVPVRLARPKCPRWVVVGQDDGRGKGLEYYGEENPDIHHGSRDPSRGCTIDSLGPIGIVQQEHLEGLLIPYGVLVPCLVEQPCHPLRIAQGFRFPYRYLFTVAYHDLVYLVFHCSFVKGESSKRGHRVPWRPLLRSVTYRPSIGSRWRRSRSHSVDCHHWLCRSLSSACP